MCYIRPVRVFAVPQVTRLLRKDRIPEATLCTVARELVEGRLTAGEANLGDGLWKKRLARRGGGKSGGYRTIVAYRRPQSERVLFAYLFAKSTAATITPAGQAALARTATAFIGASDMQVSALLAADDIREVMCDGDEA